MKRVLLVMAFVFPAFIFAQNNIETQVKVGYDYGIDADKNESFGIDLIVGYRTSEQFRIGLGTGISWCEHKYENAKFINYKYFGEYRETAAYVPLLLNGKFNFVDSSISPYLAMDLGYTIFIPFSKFAENNKLGFMFSPCFGCDYSIGSCDLFTQVGYKYQKREFDTILGTFGNYSQLVFAIGVQF